MISNWLNIACCCWRFVVGNNIFKSVQNSSHSVSKDDDDDDGATNRKMEEENEKKQTSKVIMHSICTIPKQNKIKQKNLPLSLLLGFVVVDCTIED